MSNEIDIVGPGDQDVETQDRRFFPKSEKDKMSDDEFADPENKAYPIKSPQDVINAAMNIGRTKGDKDKIKARIKSIAKRKGYPLPKAWQDEEESGGSEAKEDEKEVKEKAKERVEETSLIQELEALYRRYYSQSERESMDESDFAGPHRSFPIKTQQDVHNAASLIGHADNPGAVKSKIKSIAKKKGFSLPKSWEDEDGGDSENEEKKERAMKQQQQDDDEMDEKKSSKSSADDEDEDDDTPPAAKKKKKQSAPEEDTDQEEDQQERTVKNTPVSHAVFTGSHGHRHDHSMDGYSHEHPHDHMADNDHNHGHAHAHHRTADGLILNTHTHTPEERALYAHTERPIEQPMEKKELKPVEQTQDRAVIAGKEASMYMPFIRVDAAKREVIGQATSEVPDSYGTIFAYYPKAWETWRGNIREQHDPKKAVGKRIQHFLNGDTRSVDLHVRVSRGAQDTWMKIEDDVLTGFSLSVIPDPEYGNNIAKWPRKEYEGKQYPYLPRYSIAEVSIVDNPSCPNCNIQIVRADGFATDILAVSEEEQLPQIERIGARMSSDTMSKMHKGIKSTLHSAMTQMENCNCPQCQKAISKLDPDRDGDIDLGGLDDPDHDASQLGVDAERVVVGLIERSLQPVYTRLQKIAGTLAKTTPEQMDVEGVISRAVMRAFDTFDAKLSANQSSFEELRAELSAVRGQVDKIADQPMPGGPIMNANSLPTPQQQFAAIDKKLPTDPPIAYQKQSYGSVYDAIATLSKHGQLDTTDKQVDAMTEGLIAQRRR